MIGLGNHVFSHFEMSPDSKPSRNGRVAAHADAAGSVPSASNSRVRRSVEDVGDIDPPSCLSGSSFTYADPVGLPDQHTCTEIQP